MFETTATFPAGEYVIIDPCYVLHDAWSELCNDFFFANRTDHGCNQGEFTLKDGRRIFVGNTAYGDGLYALLDNNRNVVATIGVDAGCVGLIRLSDIDLTNQQNFIDPGFVVTFDTEFEVSVESGYFTFGNYTLNTRELEEEEEEFDDHDYYADDYESNFETDF